MAFFGTRFGSFEGAESFCRLVIATLYDIAIKINRRIAQTGIIHLSWDLVAKSCGLDEKMVLKSGQSVVAQISNGLELL